MGVIRKWKCQLIVHTISHCMAIAHFLKKSKKLYYAKVFFFFSVVLVFQSLMTKPSGADLGFLEYFVTLPYIWIVLSGSQQNHFVFVHNQKCFEQLCLTDKLHCSDIPGRHELHFSLDLLLAAPPFHLSARNPVSSSSSMGGGQCHKYCSGLG